MTTVPRADLSTTATTKAPRAARARRTGLALVVALALVGSACSGDDGGETSTAAPDDSSDTEDETTETTETAESDESDEPDDTRADLEPVPSAGCGTSEVGSVELEEQTIDVDGAERWYLLSTPAEHDGTTPLPVVVSFHGLIEGAVIHAEQSAYSALGMEEGFVVVHPNGTGDPVRWDIQPGPGNADLDFVDALLDELGADLCIDEARIYASGLSNGAMMTSLVACERAERFAAVAPVAGVTEIEGCAPSMPVPMLGFHGTEDAILLFNGGVNTSAIPGFGESAEVDDAEEEAAEPADLDGEGYPANAAAWAERNGCSEEFSDTERTDEVIDRTFDCPDGADVQFVIVLGGGHSWPGSEFSAQLVDIIGYTTFDADASHEAWEFFSRFARG